MDVTSTEAVVRAEKDRETDAAVRAVTMRWEKKLEKAKQEDEEAKRNEISAMVQQVS